MNRTEGTMEKLQILVKAAPEYLAKDPKLGMEYVTDHVVPALEGVLKDLCPKIEKRHSIDRLEEGVIHYTSINTLVSMLQQAAKNKQNAAKDEQESSNAAKDEQESSKGEQNASLRLYDSVQLNDPDEGKYFYRNLNLPKKHTWLGENKESHAYIASFILPDSKRDMSNNLIFWPTYGKEGEGCSLKLDIPICRLRKVLYGANHVKNTGKLLLPVLNSLEPLVGIRKQSIKEVQEKLAEVIWRYLEKIRYLYKSEAYDHEHECRFIVPELDANKDKICFEPKEQNNYPDVRHYYEHEDLKVENILTTDSLIMIGPCVPYPYNTIYYLKSLLNKAGLLGPKIKTSEIPYRKP